MTNRPNLVKLRGYEFEAVVPWEEIIDEMRYRRNSRGATVVSVVCRDKADEGGA